MQIADLRVFHQHIKELYCHRNSACPIQHVTMRSNERKMVGQCLRFKYSYIITRRNYSSRWFDNTVLLQQSAYINRELF